MRDSRPTPLSIEIDVAYVADKNIYKIIMSHKCKTLIFRCMDFRLRLSDFSKLLESIGCPEGSYDLVSVAGSGKDFLSEKNEADFLFKQIEISVCLHKAEEIIILYHDNCGAYGIDDLDAEHNQQNNDLFEIKKIINDKFSRLDFKAYIIKGTAEGKFSLEIAAAS